MRLLYAKKVVSQHRVERWLRLPVRRPILLPVAHDPINPAVRVASNMDVDDAIPLGSRCRLVNKYDLAAASLVLGRACCRVTMYRTSEVLNELLNTVHLQRRAHDDEHVWFLRQIGRAHGPDLVAVWMGLVVEHDGWP